MSAHAIPLERRTHDTKASGLTARTDEELMVDCAQGSEDAFRVIVDRYSSRVLNLITRWIGNRDRAEDLSQEVFLRVFQHRRNYRRTGKFSSWLYTIAVNLARNEIRNTKRRGTSIPMDTVSNSNESGTIQFADEGAHADDHARQQDAVQLVQRAIGELPVHHREILILRDIQDLKYEEIAELLGIPGGTVRSRINRARLALRQRIAEMVPPDELGFSPT